MFSETLNVSCYAAHATDQAIFVLFCVCTDMRFPTSSAVAITFFVTFLIVGVVAFLGGSVVAYLCRKRIEKVVP